MLVVASPIEARAVVAGAGGGPEPQAWVLSALSPGLELLVTGIGKANAAGATARFAQPGDHDLILNIGIAGSLGQPAIGDVVIASASVFADEGLQSPDGFQDCAAMGFPLAGFPGSAVPVSSEAVQWCRSWLSSLSPVVAPVATVSTCSGENVLAAEVQRRTGAAAEGMEGAAVGLVGFRLGLPFAEIRVISNTTGDRPSQKWDMKVALARLTEVIGALAQAMRG